MSRFDVCNFCPPPDQEFLCGICMNVLDLPMETPCRHVFCNVCILKALEKKSCCPICRKFLHSVTLKKVLPLVQNILNNLTLKCENFEKGCKQLPRLEVYLNHLKTCKYATVHCDHEGCEQSLLMMEYENHKSNVCLYRRIKCDKGCGLMLVWKEKEMHDCIRSLLSQNEDLKQQNQELESKLTNLHSVVDGLNSRLSEYETASTPRTLSIGGGGRQQNFSSSREIFNPSTTSGGASGSTVDYWEMPATPYPSYDIDYNDGNVVHNNSWDQVSNGDNGDNVADEEGEDYNGEDDYHDETHSYMEDSSELVGQDDVSNYDEQDENSNSFQTQAYNINHRDDHDDSHSENVHREGSHDHEGGADPSEARLINALVEEYMRAYNSEELSSRESDYDEDDDVLSDEDDGSAVEEEGEVSGENELEENHEGNVDHHSYNTRGSNSSDDLMVAGQTRSRAGLTSDRSYGLRKRAHEDSGTGVSNQRAKYRRTDDGTNSSCSRQHHSRSSSNSQRQSGSNRHRQASSRVFSEQESQENVSAIRREEGRRPSASSRRRSPRLHHEEPIESSIPDVRVPRSAAELLICCGSDNSSNSSLSSDDDWSPNSEYSD